VVVEWHFLGWLVVGMEGAGGLVVLWGFFLDGGRVVMVMGS